MHLSVYDPDPICEIPTITLSNPEGFPNSIISLVQNYGSFAGQGKKAEPFKTYISVLGNHSTVHCGGVTS